MDTSLPGTPAKSETFLAPAFCTYKKGDESFVASQNAQRERITCGLALDVHYELNVPSNEGGLEETRLQPFNPAKHSPACGYNYTGKFVDEETFRSLYDDPVKLGEAIEAQEAYDAPLYAIRDPRLVTKTQVIRDFGCKIPIDLADQQNLAEAVLNYYPDKYVTFLNQFVSNLFGDAMKHFLALQIDGYRKMLDNPSELNRISWGAFTSVRGKEDPAGLPGTNQQDVSLRMDAGIKDELNKLALNGTGMTSNVNARDIYDVKPCIEQHIETLRTMHDEWCQGYATKEMYALVMMYYANEQGRRLCWDRRLMSKQDTPDYDEIRLHVPATLYEAGAPDLASSGESNPDRLSAIHRSLGVEEKTCEQIETFAYSVGRWSGSEEMANVFLNSATQAPFMWGWGHPANLMHHIRDSTVNPREIVARIVKHILLALSAAATAAAAVGGADVAAVVADARATGFIFPFLDDQALAAADANDARDIYTAAALDDASDAAIAARIKVPTTLMQMVTNAELVAVPAPSADELATSFTTEQFNSLTREQTTFGPNNVRHILAPYLDYNVGGGYPYTNPMGETRDLLWLNQTHLKVSRMYVTKWRSLWRQDTQSMAADTTYDHDRSDLVPKGHKERRQGLRAALLEPGPDVARGEGLMHYRGAPDDPTTYRAVQGLPTGGDAAATARPLHPSDAAGNTILGTNTTGMVNPLVSSRPHPTQDDVVCFSEEGIQIFDKNYFSCGTKYDPFLQSGPCFELDEHSGDYVMNAKRMELYKVDDVVSNPVTGKLMFSAMSLLIDGAAPYLGKVNGLNNAKLLELVAKYNSTSNAAGSINKNLAKNPAADTCELLTTTVGDALTFFENTSGAQVTSRLTMLKTLLKTLQLKELDIPFRVIAKGLFSPCTRSVDVIQDPQAMLQSLFQASDTTVDYVTTDSGFAPTKTLKVNMSDAKPESRTGQLSMKLVAFRKAIQYSLGPDVAFVICRDPLGTVRPFQEFLQTWNNADAKKAGGWSGNWKLNMHKYIDFLEMRTKVITQSCIQVLSQYGYQDGVGVGDMAPYVDALFQRDEFALKQLLAALEDGAGNSIPFADDAGKFAEELKKRITQLCSSVQTQFDLSNSQRPTAANFATDGFAARTSKAIARVCVALNPNISEFEHELASAIHAQAVNLDGGGGAGRFRGDAVPLFTSRMPGLGAGWVNTPACVIFDNVLANGKKILRTTPERDRSLRIPLPLDGSSDALMQLQTTEAIQSPTFPDLSLAQVMKYDLVSFEHSGQRNSPLREEMLMKFMMYTFNDRFSKFTITNDKLRNTEVKKEAIKAAADLPFLGMSGDLAADCCEIERTEEAAPANNNEEIGVGDCIKSMRFGRKRLCALFANKHDDDFPAELAQLMYSMLGLLVDPRMMYYPSLQAYASDYKKSSDVDLLLDAAQEMISSAVPQVDNQAVTGQRTIQNAVAPGRVSGSMDAFCSHIITHCFGDTGTDTQGVFMRLSLQSFYESFDPSKSKDSNVFRGTSGYDQPYGLTSTLISAVNNGIVPNAFPIGSLANANNVRQSTDLSGPAPNLAEIEGAGTLWNVHTSRPQITSSEMSFLPLKKIADPNVVRGMPQRFVGYYNSAAVSTSNAVFQLNQARGSNTPPVGQIPSIKCRAQLFAMLDAAALLWGRRCFFNPADSHRPHPHPEEGDSGDMHPWCQILVESFLASREKFNNERGETDFWEEIVHNEPEQALSAKKFIGALCDDSFKKLFPLIPQDHKIRDCLRKVRSLNVMWGMLPSYGIGQFDAVASKQGAWMPLSEAHRVRLLKNVGLFDFKNQVPSNPWLPRNGEGLCTVYSQSYHSVYPVDSVNSTHFREWVKDVCRYQPPNKSPDFCNYPFSQYGGTPVEADFLWHKVEAPDEDDDYVAKRHAQLVYNRFGFTKAMRLGQQFHDSGFLQDLYSYSYRSHIKLSKEQKAMPKATEIYPSNFMAYARNHAILALASCNHGTKDVSKARVVRNLYRMFVDSYDVCAGMPSDNDHVPVVMGFLPNYVTSKADRPMIMFAGSLPCLNAKLEKFCFSTANAGEKICQNYKQTYLNDAALLFTRLVRADRRRGLHRRNYRRAAAKRGGNYTPIQFFQELVDVQDAYIEFLQTTLLSMALESDVDMKSLPLHLLEPREVEVPVHVEDSDVVGNDFLGPRTLDIIKDLKIDGDNISKTQLAILSLMPPNHRVLGTLRLNQDTEIVDLEHVRKQVQKQAIEGNKKVWGNHLQKVIRASLGMRFLEQNGPIDFSLDETAFKDPLAESAKIGRYMTTTNSQAQSSITQNQAAYNMRKNTGPSGVLKMNTKEYQEALQVVRDLVARNYEKARGGKSHLDCLLELRVPEHVKNELRKEYTQRIMY